MLQWDVDAPRLQIQYSAPHALRFFVEEPIDKQKRRIRVWSEERGAEVEHFVCDDERTLAYLANHRGHLMFLRPEEQEVCTADLIRTMTFTGTRPALQDRLRELREAGYNHFAISIRHGHPGMLEDWADVFAGV